MDEKTINKAMENRFDGIESCVIVRELLECEAENAKLKAGLISVRKSTEIMEARRFADQALKDTNDKEES